VPAASVENAGWQIGMPVGPLAVLDEVSLKLADDVLHQELADLEREQQGHAHEHAHEHGHKHEHEHEHEHGHAHRHAHKVKSRRVPEAAVYVLEKMAHGFRRMGRSYGGGFYDYPPDGEKSLWPGLKAFERGARAIPFDDVKDRMLYVQAIETVRCLEEGVLESTRDANIGSIFGWGFPGWTGGTAQFVNHVGVRRFVARAQELAQRYGERFMPPALLMQHAERDEPL
jgi:3-hydroxyacyl-CoA dehydrogenase/enoyl-CoA hydratase/3-hydroxybutyryl-CoA epimerase